MTDVIWSVIRQGPSDMEIMASFQDYQEAREYLNECLLEAWECDRYDLAESLLHPYKIKTETPHARRSD